MQKKTQGNLVNISQELYENPSENNATIWKTVLTSQPTRKSIYRVSVLIHSHSRLALVGSAVRGWHRPYATEALTKLFCHLHLFAIAGLSLVPTGTHEKDFDFFQARRSSRVTCAICLWEEPCACTPLRQRPYTNQPDNIQEHWNYAKRHEEIM